MDGSRHELRPGTMTVTRPWQRHRVGLPDIAASRLIWIIIDVGVRRPNQAWRWPDWLVLGGDELARLSRLLQHNEQPVWQAGSALHRSFERLAAIVDAPGASMAVSRLKLAINELLVDILELLECQPIALDAELASARRAVSVFLAALGEHLDRPWSLAEMAAACGLGRTQFTRYCRELTNRPPMTYLRDLRVDRARRLLADRPDLTVTDIAGQCGFETSQYFATCFRAATGRTPRAYRAGG